VSSPRFDPRQAASSSTETGVMSPPIAARCSRQRSSSFSSFWARATSASASHRASSGASASARGRQPRARSGLASCSSAIRPASSAISPRSVGSLAIS
jgi:hypothetical protein